MTEPQIPPDNSAADAATTGSTNANNPSPQSAPPPPKKRRRWRWIAASLLVLLALVLLLAPTIASTSLVRPLIVQQINKTLDGQVHISNWSLGWFTGIHLSGVRVTQDGAQIAELHDLSTQLTLLRAIRGNLDLGKTTIQGLDILLIIYPDGRTNFHRLLRLPPASEGPLTVPQLRGQIHADLRGTIARTGQPPLLIDPSSLQADITDINAPITHQLNLALRVGSANAGKVHAAGSLRLFHNNTLDLAKLSADQTLTIQNLDLAASSPLLPHDAGINRLAGTLNGSFTAKAPPSGQITLAGSLVCDSLALSGPTLAPDTYRTTRAVITIPQTTFDPQTGLLRSQSPITFTTDQGNLSLSLDATRQSLTNLAANRAPGSPGTLTLASQFDLAQLAQQLPTLLNLKQGIKPVSGKITHNTLITLAPNQAAIKTTLDLSDLAATDPNGRKIQAQPLNLSLSATSLGGGGLLPDLRDLAIQLRSRFATIDGKGDSLAKLHVTGQASLLELQREAAQFLDLGPLTLTGQARFSLSATGQLANEDDSAPLHALFSATDLQVRNDQIIHIQQPWLELSANATLIRGKNQFIKAFRDAAFTLRSGDPDKPSLDLSASAQLAPGSSTPLAVPNFQLAKCNVDLAAAQKQFVAAANSLRNSGWVIPPGNLSLTAAGSWDGESAALKTLSLTSPLGNLALADALLRIPKNASPSSPLDILQQATLSLDLPDLANASKILASAAVPQTPSDPPDADAPTTQPAQPIILTSGSLKLAMRLERSPKGLALTLNDLAGRNIAFQRASGRYELPDLNTRLVALVATNNTKPNTTLLQQISEIQISQLAGNAGPANWSLAEPLSIKGLDSTLQAQGSIKLAGDLRQIADILQALQGHEPASTTPYAGAYSLTQRLRTQGASVSLLGDLAIDNFAVGPSHKPSFAEKSIRITDEITLDQKAKSITITKLTLDMADSKALGLSVSGAVSDYPKQRILDNIQLLLSYDAAKLLEIVRPLLSPESQQQLQTLKLTGLVRDRRIAVAGKYPVLSEKAIRQKISPIQSVKASGILSFDRVEYQQMVGEFKEVPFVLADGILKIAYPDRPPAQQLPTPYPFNGGKLDLGGLEIAVGAQELRLNSTRQNHKLLDNVTINRSFVEQYLGKLNPLFTVPKDAKGAINLTINELNQLPLGPSLSKPKRNEVGRGKFTFSITDLQIDSLFMALLAQQLQFKLAPGGALQTNIRDAVVQIEAGIVKSDIALDIGGQLIGMKNTEIALASQKIRNMEMLIPKPLLSQYVLGQLGSKQSLIKDNIVVPVKGTLAKSEFNILDAALKSINVGGVINQFLGNQPDEKKTR